MILSFHVWLSDPPHKNIPKSKPRRRWRWSMTLGQSCRSLGTSTKHVNLAVFLNGEGPETSNNNVTSLKKLYLKCRVQKKTKILRVFGGNSPILLCSFLAVPSILRYSETILVSTGGYWLNHHQCPVTGVMTQNLLRRVFLNDEGLPTIQIITTNDV